MAQKEKLITNIQKNKERAKAKAEEVAKLFKLGKKEFKNVTLGTIKSSEETMFCFGFLAGYKFKEKESK